MRSHPAHALLALLLAATAAGNVLRIPVARNSPGTVTRRHRRLSRRATFTESLANNITGGGYYASVSVGTPGQDIDMILDTGSSDAFIVAAGADLCESPRLQLIYQTSCGQTCEFVYYSNPPRKNLRRRWKRMTSVTSTPRWMGPQICFGQSVTVLVFLYLRPAADHAYS